MDLITNLSIGFGVAVTPINLLYAFIGCLLGTLIGVLPGIGPVATIAMLLPATYTLPPVSARLEHLPQPGSGKRLADSAPGPLSASSRRSTLTRR